jgi:hypothetical protein
MEQLWEWLDYLRDHPLVVAGIVAALGTLYYLLNRKPKLQRDAEARFDDLRRQHDDVYRGLRPPH